MHDGCIDATVAENRQSSVADRDVACYPGLIIYRDSNWPYPTQLVN